ncbi:MAG TPA: HEAT repeat domain-containing protein [Nitrospirota bacterium]|nr:HEAT repeat domain-containing protein [Nitrospirota bacterium]
MRNLEELARRLASEDAEERREAAVDLGRSGRDALPLFFRAMGDADWRVRKTAVEGIVALEGEQVIAGLLGALNAPDNAGARNSAIEALISINGPAVDALLANLSTHDPDVRKFIVDILGEIKDARAVPALIERLGDGDENIRVAAAEALGKIGDRRAVDPLLECLARSDQGWLDYAVAEALGAIGDERALGPLLAALGRSGLREPVLEALGRIGNAGTIGPLVAGLGDPLRIVREVSVAAVWAIYKKSTPPDRKRIIAAVRAGMTAQAADLLEDILAQSTGDLQKATIILLGWSGRDRSLRKILSLLNEESLEDAVALALEQVGPAHTGLLVEALASGNALVRRAAAQALGFLGVQGADEALYPLLNDENGHVRSAAAEALGRMRSAKACGRILPLLTDEYVSVQESAIEALAAIGDESVLQGLLSDFSAHKPALRRNIVLLLGRFSSEQAGEALAFALKDEEPSVRTAVIQGLGRASGGRALQSLMLAITDDDAEVRMMAAEALGRTQAPEARDALVPLLKDSDIWVRAAAARGLGTIDGARTAEILVEHLAQATDIFLLAIVETLGRGREPLALRPLLGLAGHPDPEVRKTVLTALAAYDGEDVLQACIARLDDPHWCVRKAAVQALQNRRTDAVDTLLEKIAGTDADMTVRRAAKEALGR